MATPIAVSTFEQTTTACPTQWQAQTVDGRYVYIRYRWGWLRAEITGPETNPATLFRAQVGEELDGSMSTLAMLGHLAAILDFTQAREIPLDSEPQPE